MPFLVYEKDAFVQADIFETLSSAFPECDVAELPDVALLRDASKLADHPIVAVLSAKWCEVKAQFAGWDDWEQKLSLVLIGDEASDIGEGRDIPAFVQRPFSSETLLQAVRNALSSQPSFLK